MQERVWVQPLSRRAQARQKVTKIPLSGGYRESFLLHSARASNKHGLAVEGGSTCRGEGRQGCVSRCLTEAYPATVDVFVVGPLGPAPMSDTTIRRGTAANADDEVHVLGIVILSYPDEPHRVGEVSFPTAFEEAFFGRHDGEGGTFIYFFQQLPGQPLPPYSPERRLLGKGLSRRHLRFLTTAVGIEIENRKDTPLHVNGEVKRRAVLKENDVFTIPGAFVGLVVRRPRVLPGPPARHAFGGADADGMVGESLRMWQLRDQLAKAAAMTCHVLLLGETGTGKTASAESIHRQSKRGKRPYGRFNVQAIERNLIVAELFGSLKNYPNAGMPARDGIVGALDTGTLCLDEAGSADPMLQTALLSFLDDGGYQRVGESTTRHADLRVIGTTNKAETDFLYDFRRRFGYVVRVPSLRERKEDLPFLMRNWVFRLLRRRPELERFVFDGANGERDVRLHVRLVDYVARQELTGNVRELDELMEEAVIASPGNEIRLPKSRESLVGVQAVTPPGAPPSKRKPTKEELVALLEEEGGSVLRVWQRTGLGRSVIYGLMEKYGLREKKDDTEK
jgi:DNA-binding NtrC family response regulator